MSRHMKIISFTGGLGNQLFEYLFYRHLARRYPSTTIYGYYSHGRLKYHNGLEIQRWFDVELPPSSFLTDCISVLMRVLIKLRLAHASNEATYTDGKNGLFFEGFWQGFRFQEATDVAALRFRRGIPLSAANRTIINRMNGDEHSVAIHVRRGDYLEGIHASFLGNVCAPDYYERALGALRRQLGEAAWRLYVFSDDADWCRKTFGHWPQTTFVDWNTGADSFYDLYLMAHCRHHVIANSTFSYWGARMAVRKGVTIYPRMWFRGYPSPDIFPHDWIAIGSEPER